MREGSLELAQGFKDLEVWQLGRQLAKDVFQVTSSFPASETYGLTSQLRRAAVSVPSNIAEGWGRQSDPSFANFVRIARGSLNELQTQLILARDFGYLGEGELNRLENAIGLLGRKLYNLGERLSGRSVHEELGEYGAEQPLPSLPSLPSP